MSKPNLELKYNGVTLPADITQQLINYAERDLKVPPSYLITKLHYEGLWGDSGTARNNNNWGGITWNTSWNNPHTRPSGIIVTRGTRRPANEGGHYVKYKSVNDFLVDWSYLIRRGGIYKVADSNTFANAVKGMFRYGGASADYATMNIPDGTGASKRRYELYLAGMEGRRNAINSANNNVLNVLDENDYSGGDSPDPKPDPDPDPDPKPEPEPEPEPELDFSSLIKYVTDFGNNFKKEIEKMLVINLFDYGNSKTFGNNFLKVDQTFSNMYKIKPTLNFSKVIDDFISKGLNGLDGIIDTIKPKPKPDPQPDPDPKPDPDPQPEPSGKFYFPLNPKARGINFWTPPDQPAMDYGGPREGRRHWAYDIGTGGNANVSCHSVKDGEVLSVNADNLGTVVIKNSTDDYYIQYMHLKLGAFTVKKGDTVKAGEKIGIVGGTGGYAIHLHIAVSINGTFGTEKDTINPRTYLKVTGNNKTNLPSPV